MERLTKEELENYRNTYDKFDGVESNVFEKICNELIEYKSLEEELGKDLPTLFKALKGYIYYNDCGKIIKVPVLGINPMRENKFCLECYYDFKNFRVDTTDYGKTWWLEKPKEINDD